MPTQSDLFLHPSHSFCSLQCAARRSLQSELAMQSTHWEWSVSHTSERSVQ